MNKLLTTAGLVVLATAATSAHAGTEPSAASATPAHRYTAVDGSGQLPTLYNGPRAGKGTAAIQELSFSVVDSLLNAFSFYTEDAQPFVYKPDADLLVMIRRGAEDAATNPGTTSDKDDLYISSSPDWGMTWPQNLQYGPLRADATTSPARYPSVYLATPEDIHTYLFSAPLVVNPGAGTNEWAWGHVLQGVLIPSVDVLYAEDVGPLVHNGANYEWGTDSKLTSVDDNVIVKVGSVTRLGQPMSENNTFGVTRIDLNEGDPFTDPFIPPQWRSDQFLTSTSTAPFARTTSMSGLDHDGQAIYFGISGIFTDNNPDQFALPAVSKSSDNGLTWSEFDVCPASLISDYGNSLSANPDSVSIGFAPDFVVTGPDRYSFAANFFYKTIARPDSQIAHVVEVYKENGSWGIRKIGDYSGLVWLFFSDEENATQTDQTQLGNELQLVKTVDGSKLLAKWIDFVTVDINGTPQNSSDVFINARDIDGSWNAEPRNITESIMLDKITWLPNYVPNDLMNIPMLAIQSMPTASETDPVEVNITIQRRIVGRTQYIMATHFDAATLVGVEEAEQNAAPLLGVASPNPAGDVARIDFTLPAGGRAVVDLVDATGRNVLPLFNGEAHAGTNRLTVDTRSLPAGTYYYRLQWNGRTETRMLTVVR